MNSSDQFTDCLGVFTGSYTDLGELTANEHPTNLSVMNRKRTNHSAVFSHMIAQHVEELPLNQSLCNKNEIAVCSTALRDQSKCSIQSHDSSACKRAATRITATNCCISKAFTSLHILQVRM